MHSCFRSAAIHNRFLSGIGVFDIASRQHLPSYLLWENLLIFFFVDSFKHSKIKRYHMYVYWGQSILQGFQFLLCQKPLFIPWDCILIHISILLKLQNGHFQYDKGFWKKIPVYYRTDIRKSEWNSRICIKCENGAAVQPGGARDTSKVDNSL